MNNLILVIVSIALMSAVASLSVRYIPSAAYEKQQTHGQIRKGVSQLEAGVTRYLQGTTSPEGAMQYPGNGVDVKNLMSPVFGYMPPDVKNQITWEVRAGSVHGLQAIGICAKPIDGVGTETMRDIFKNVQSQMPVQSTFVGGGCNATADTPGGTYFTRWIVLQHLQ